MTPFTLKMKETGELGICVDQNTQFISIQDEEGNPDVAPALTLVVLFEKNREPQICYASEVEWISVPTLSEEADEDDAGEESESAQLDQAAYDAEAAQMDQAAYDHVSDSGESLD